MLPKSFFGGLWSKSFTIFLGSDPDENDGSDNKPAGSSDSDEEQEVEVEDRSSNDVGKSMLDYALIAFTWAKFHTTPAVFFTVAILVMDFSISFAFAKPCLQRFFLNVWYQGVLARV